MMMIKHADNYLKQLRLHKGLTVQELSQLTQISKSAIYKYESGQVVPNPKAVLRLCKVLGCNMEEVYRTYYPE